MDRPQGLRKFAVPFGLNCSRIHAFAVVTRLRGDFYFTVSSISFLAWFSWRCMLYLIWHLTISFSGILFGFGCLSPFFKWHWHGNSNRIESYGCWIVAQTLVRTYLVADLPNPGFHSLYRQEWARGSSSLLWRPWRGPGPSSLWWKCHGQNITQREKGYSGIAKADARLWSIHFWAEFLWIWNFLWNFLWNEWIWVGRQLHISTKWKFCICIPIIRLMSVTRLHWICVKGFDTTSQYTTESTELV